MPFDIPGVGATEADSERNGFLSTRAEIHALSIGIAVGFVSVSPVPKTREFVYRVVGLVDEDGGIDSRSKALREAKKESWYATGGVVLGAVFGVAIMLLATLGVIAAPSAFDASLVDVVEAFAG